MVPVVLLCDGNSTAGLGMEVVVAGKLFLAGIEVG